MAKRFEFRLDALLRVRQLAVDQQRRMLADAVRGMSLVDERVARADAQRLDEIRVGRGIRESSQVDMASLRTHQLHRGAIARSLQAAQDELRSMQDALTLQRERFAIAKKNLQVIEKLHERHWRRFRREQERVEQTLADETATQQFLRSRRRACEIFE